ncbi:unnamed protein product, partial [Iphiclides podalirius]
MIDSAYVSFTRGLQSAAYALRRNTCGIKEKKGRQAVGVQGDTCPAAEYTEMYPEIHPLRLQGCVLEQLENKCRRR